MRIGYVVNDIKTELPAYTTTRLAMTAINAGHETWVMGVGDFAYDRDESLCARARRAPNKNYRSNSSYLEDLQGKKAVRERIGIQDLDVLMLRNDPAADAERPWAQTAGIIFGQLAAARGTIVVNHPNSLADAINKMYFQHFPSEVRPRTLITRDPDEIKNFVKEEKGKVVLKPLQGSGGQGVFLVRPDDPANLSQMIDAIVRDGYVVAQEYLKAATEGDTRLFMLNGEPLKRKGKYAAFRRVNQSGDMRSNMHAGGKAAKAKITDDIMRLVEIVRPKLIRDGMFLVGLDIVGEKLMEVNVFSPGGLGSAQDLEGVNFCVSVIEALERKIAYRAQYQENIRNETLAVL